jgi:GNAT superfamily N-acetyltransferase
MDEIRIRVATLADLDAITANNIAMAAETENLQLDPVRARSGVRRVLTDTQRGTYFLAEREGKVLGQLLITREWSDWRDDWFWWLQSVYVVPPARGSGVYSVLHHHVEQLARKSPGVCGLRLYVHRQNATAVQIYQQLGMRQTNYDLMEVSWKGAPQGGPARP